MADISERFTGIIEEVVGDYHQLPLSPAIAGYYLQVAEEAAEDTPSADLLDNVVRTAVSLELDEMKSTGVLVARITNILRARREALPQSPTFDA